MELIECKIVIHNPNSVHLNQIIAGFIELENQNYIKISKKVVNDSVYDYLEVIINNEIRVIYDTMDSGKVYVPDLEWDKVDYYFKRSYKRELAEKISQKIYPLGLNYDVHSKYSNFQTIKYNIKDFLKRILFLGKNKFYIEDFEIKRKEPNNKICFLTRFWDPNGKEVEDESVREERKKINDFRAECIRSCKKRYGDKFIGGVPYSDFANKYFNDCIVDNSKITERSKYLDLIKNYDICIATTGLHKSIGWKFAEYIAMGKVIVSEPLEYEVPGILVKGKNYLEFRTVDELINNIDALIENKEKRMKIQNNNLDYYNKYLRADKLVLNTINIIIEQRIDNYEKNS